MSTFSDQLLIKSLFQAPIQDHLDQEIVQAESRRFTYAQFRERVFNFKDIPPLSYMTTDRKSVV